MERILIFGNTHESREAAQTMRQAGYRLRDDGIRARTAAAGNDVPHRAV